MIDIHFIQFYIRKKYNKSLEQYFNISKPIASTWRNKHFPGSRLKEFLEKEGTLDPHILFNRIYKKEG